MPVIPVRFTVPDNSGNVVIIPAAVNLLANDFFPFDVVEFLDTATRIGCGIHFRVPSDYRGNPAFLVNYATTATSGNFDCEVDYRCIAVTESIDPSSAQETVEATRAVPGTARLLDEISLAATAANFAPEDLVFGSLFRDGAQSDTVAATIYVPSMWFSYTN